jgi:threonine dehydrogenase-like Zn-dependent dehydrogenase
MLDDRLQVARTLGAEVVDAGREDPVEIVRELTGGIGADRAIDAVGVDAVRPRDGEARGRENGQQWAPGDAPDLALRWAVDSVAKAGSVGVIGVYPPQMDSFPLGTAMNRNLTVHMGNCNHRSYVPMLVGRARAGEIDPTRVLTQREPIDDVLEAYRNFDLRSRGWVKVRVVPGDGRSGIPLRGAASESMR